MSQELFDSQVAALKEFFEPRMYPKGSLKKAPPKFKSPAFFINLITLDMSKRPQCKREEIKEYNERYTQEEKKTPRIELKIWMHQYDDGLSTYDIDIHRVAKSRSAESNFYLEITYDERYSSAGFTEKDMSLDFNVSLYLEHCLGIDMSYVTLHSMRKNLDKIGMQ